MPAGLDPLPTDFALDFAPLDSARQQGGELFVYRAHHLAQVGLGKMRKIIRFGQHDTGNQVKLGLEKLLPAPMQELAQYNFRALRYVVFSIANDFDPCAARSRITASKRSCLLEK